MMRKVLITFNEMDAKSETSSLNNLSVERKKTLVENITDTPVGFTSRLMGVYSNTFTNIESYMILYNQGGAYNGTVFTCPSPGLYLFQVSLITFSVNNGIRMYKNFQQLTLAFSGASPQANGASASAATWLEIGDEVYLRPHNSSLDVDFNSVFTGVKII
uniref:C1q domain-containing protein n=1 Tax=Magallana gigas TaxID=29159 RepID=A0A8W8MJU1_MAGGI